MAVAFECIPKPSNVEPQLALVISEELNVSVTTELEVIWNSNNALILNITTNDKALINDTIHITKVSLGMTRTESSLLSIFSRYVEELVSGKLKVTLRFPEGGSSYVGTEFIFKLSLRDDVRDNAGDRLSFGTTWLPPR